MTDIFELVAKNEISSVQALLDGKPELINMKNVIGHSCLSLALECDNVELAQLLIDAGADINEIIKLHSPVSKKNNKTGPPLVFVKSERAVNLLLERGATLENSAENGKSIFVMVGRLYRIEILDRLLDAGMVVEGGELQTLKFMVSEELEFRQCDLGAKDDDPRVIKLKSMLSWLNDQPSG